MTSRSATATWARPPTSRAGGPSSPPSALNFGGFLGWLVWLFIHIGFLTGYRNRVGAILGWWFAFTRDLRRERTFTIDDMPAPSGAYSDPGEPGHPAGAGL